MSAEFFGRPKNSRSLTLVYSLDEWTKRGKISGWSPTAARYRFDSPFSGDSKRDIKKKHANPVRFHFNSSRGWPIRVSLFVWNREYDAIEGWWNTVDVDDSAQPICFRGQNAAQTLLPPPPCAKPQDAAEWAFDATTSLQLGQACRWWRSRCTDVHGCSFNTPVLGTRRPWSERSISALTCRDSEVIGTPVFSSHLGPSRTAAENELGW